MTTNDNKLRGVGRDGVAENVPEIREEIMRERKTPKQQNAEQQQNQQGGRGQQKYRLTAAVDAHGRGRNSFKTSRTQFDLVLMGILRLA